MILRIYLGTIMSATVGKRNGQITRTCLFGGAVLKYITHHYKSILVGVVRKNINGVRLPLPLIKSTDYPYLSIQELLTDITTISKISLLLN